MGFEPPFPPPAEVPPDASPPGPPASGGTAWDRRDQIGLVNALVETTQAVLLRPREFYEAMPVAGGVGGPLLYALILGYLGLVATTVYNLVFNSIFASGLHRFGGVGGDRSAQLDRLLEFYGTWGGALWQLATGPIWIVVGAFVGAGILHLVLMLIGGAHRDFEATFRVVAFANAVNLLGLLPFCGSLVAVVWWLGVATVGLSVVHRISTGQALLAVLLPVFLCCCCCLGLVGLFASTIAQIAGQMQ